jgi:serine O-acetyltransferase
MPDPVGQAISVLIDRISFLEARVAHLQQDRRRATQTCPDCGEEIEK